MDELQQIENLRCLIQSSCNTLIQHLGPIQIGTPAQFPFGWRNAAKGRTVWRIVEEAVTQNIESHARELNISQFMPPVSEVGVYDMACAYGNDTAFINIKSSADGGKAQKDDISKAEGLRTFFEEDLNRHIFIVTFYIHFNDNMTIELSHATVFPLAWIPDVYVNPSNNGNLQSAHYKNIQEAVRRTNAQFYNELIAAMQVAEQKKRTKKVSAV